MEDDVIHTGTVKIITDVIESTMSEGAIDVPILPTVASKVIALSNDADSSAAELATLIQSDPALAAHVMRVANSAVYSPTSSIVSLQQAVARLGMSLITEIAVFASLNSKLFYTPGFESDTTSIFQHGLLTALWAKEISRTARKNVEATFLCGLLHSIGKPVTLHMSLSICHQQNVSLPRECHLSIVEQFYQSLGVTTLEQWGMPKMIVETINNYEHFQNITQFKDQCATIFAASLLATESQNNPDEITQENLASICQNDVWTALNLYQDEVEKIISLKADTLATMNAMEN